MLDIITYSIPWMQEDYNYIVSGWQSKLKRCAKDEQKWGLFIAYKSAFAAANGN